MSKRAVRLVVLHDLLRERAYTTAQLALLVEATPQTVSSDLLMLQMPPMCASLRADSEGRWRLER